MYISPVELERRTKPSLQKGNWTFLIIVDMQVPKHKFYIMRKIENNDATC